MESLGESLPLQNHDMIVVLLIAFVWGDLRNLREDPSMSDEPEDQTRAAARQFAIRAGIAKLADIVNEYHSAKAEEERGNIIVAHARTRMATAIERHKQLIVMAQLFEFDLDREYSAYWDRQFELPQTDDKAVGRCQHYRLHDRRAFLARSWMANPLRTELLHPT